jgi:hypothetical protein
MKTIRVLKWLCQNVFTGVRTTYNISKAVVTVPARVVGNTLLIFLYYSILGI